MSDAAKTSRYQALLERIEAALGFHGVYAQPDELRERDVIDEIRQLRERESAMRGARA
jgi:hypothetical protein